MPTLAEQLDRVDTLVVLMLENRSFDHLLGSLCLPGGGMPEVDGLREDSSFQASFRSSGVAPFPWGKRPFFPSTELPPHERDAIAVQLGSPGRPMTGFVDAYRLFPAGRGAPDDGSPPEVMGYLTADEAPVSHFLARHFTVCDRWFSALPASTQPNRLMALSGTTLRAWTKEGSHCLLPHQRLVFDWLDAHQPAIRWRVYHDGFPFLTLMPSQHERILFGPYRRLDRLAADVASEPESTFPQVLFLEPSFSGVLGQANDNHPPQPISFGEELLRRVYLALSGNAGRWAKTLLLVTYDEHGGFFDHVAPPAILTPKPPEPLVEQDYGEPFETLGVRVPALVASPMIAPGVCHALFDHTSFLTLVAQRFGLAERDYACLDRRSTDGSLRVQSLADLELANLSGASRPAPPEVIAQPPITVDRPIAEANVEAAMALWNHDPQRAAERFPELTRPLF
jgi:phospholipase C